MKKLLTITICMILVLSASSFATKTRVLTMGENNMILLDEANIWLFPSRTFDYPDIATAELNYRNTSYYPSVSGSDPYYDSDATVGEFGVHWKFGTEKPFVLGTYLFNEEGQYYGDAYFGALMLPARLGEGGYGYYTGPLLDFFNPSEWGYPPEMSGFDYYSNRRLGLFYSRPLGQNTFGFSFEKLHSSYRDEDNGEEQDDVSFSRYNFGVGLTGPGGQWDVAAHLQMITWRNIDGIRTIDGTDTTYSQSDYTKPSGNMVFDVYGRYFKQYNPTITFVPHVGIMLGKFESEDYYYSTPNLSTDFQTNPEVHKVSMMSIDLGSGMHYTPANNVLAVIDFGINYIKVNFENDNTIDDEGEDLLVTYKENVKIFSLPYIKLGFEGDVFSWMTARFGATTYWRSLAWEDEDDSDKEIMRYPSNKTYMGLGFNWNRLHIDAYTDPELFLNGFDFVSGSGSTDQMNFQLSVLYDM